MNTVPIPSPPAAANGQYPVVIFNYANVDPGFVLFHISGDLSAFIHFRQRLQRDK
jgi:hypothetical protein